MPKISAAVYAILATLALTIFASLLLGYQLHLPRFDNVYHRERAERLGSEAARANAYVTELPGNTVVLDALGKRAVARAQWQLPRYEFSHLGASSVACNLEIYVTGGAVQSRAKNAYADVRLNGELIRRIALGNQRSAAAFAPIFFTPLYQPVGIEFPVPRASACRSTTWNLELEVHRARWIVERVGVVLFYVPPARLLAGSLPLTAALAAVVVCALLFGAFALFRIVAVQYGIAAVLACLAIMALALVTHDQWDFPVWVRFANLLAFGNGNPALMWAGTPLWPLLVSVVVPVQLAFASLAGSSSSEIPALLLKLGLAQALCWTAYVAARGARLEHRPLAFWMALLSPMGLYEIAAGYREVLAGLLAVLGMSVALRRKYFGATLLLAAAGSVSESLLPLIVLPAALAFAEDRKNLKNAARSLAYFIFAAALIVVQWLALPPQAAKSMIAFRAHSYRYGEGSWLGLLTAYNAIPAWVGEYWSTWIALGVFAAIAAAFAFKYGRMVMENVATLPERPLNVLACVAGLVFAFFLSYSGADISTWWTLIVVAMFLFYRMDVLNPYPLLVSTTAAACQYAVAGTRDFVNWTYLWPQDKGLFGVLGLPVHVFAGVTVGLIAAGALALWSGRYSALFGKATPSIGVLFALAGFAITIRVYPLDVIFCVAASLLIGGTLLRLWQARSARAPWRTDRRVRALGSVCNAATTIAFAGGDVLWTAVGIVVTTTGFMYGLGYCDAALALGTLWLTKTQPGYGWLSFTAYTLLFVTAAVLAVRIAQRRGAVDADDMDIANAG